jgi:hypothetical protein
MREHVHLLLSEPQRDGSSDRSVFSYSRKKIEPALSGRLDCFMN